MQGLDLNEDNEKKLVDGIFSSAIDCLSGEMGACISICLSGEGWLSGSCLSRCSVLVLVVRDRAYPLRRLRPPVG